MSLFNPVPEFQSFFDIHAVRSVINAQESYTVYLFELDSKTAIEAGWSAFEGSAEFKLVQSQTITTEGEVVQMDEMTKWVPILVNSQQLTDFEVIMAHLNAEDDSLCQEYLAKYLAPVIGWEED